MAKINKKGQPSGKIGNVVYRELNNKSIMQRMPTKVKQTTNTQIAAQEFGISSNATKIIRQIASLLFEYIDPYISGRLNAIMQKCISQIPEAAGHKNLNHIDPSPFIGFQFNPDAAFEKTFQAFPHCIIQQDGSVEITIQAITPKKDIPFLQRDINPDPGAFLRVALVSIDYAHEEYQILAHEEIVLAKAKMENEPLPDTFDVQWKCLKKTPREAVVFVYFSLHYYQLDWLEHRKIIGEKTMNPAGFLHAFAVNEEMYTQNHAVAIGPEHQPLREAEWFYTILSAKKIEIDRIKTNAGKKKK
ncbi:hypothetical protein [Olivibacter domesticus]|uniref:Uncharacterized protein n=1 Tax=Olivibacter domesticus TaxID=407022 RepID=A0A1H7XVM0_OLID1|nr:hypothetical protein [Olivibacter domesticus]SEM37049.1 hypothetical protein SAMN05661044_04988 [Olivibacter domesticus]